MPKTLKKQDMVPTPAKPPAPKPPVAPVGVALAQPVETRKVVHKELKIAEFSSASPLGPLTIADIKVTMGWETEQEFQARMVKAVECAKDAVKQGLTGDAAIKSIKELAVIPGQSVNTSWSEASKALTIAVTNPDTESKPEHWLYGDNYHCLNVDGKKVTCRHNANNRPFDAGWCDSLAHTHLTGQWAGPLMMPGETVNGETIRVSRYARLMSGQHSLTGAVIADEWLQKVREHANNPGKMLPEGWLKKFGPGPFSAWDGHEHVVMETIVITGLSEDERVLRTIDYVKPRTEADMLYTMPLYRNNTPTERKEITRMLSAARALLWRRTDTKGYETHPEVIGFLERHKKLLKCAEHLFLENKPLASGGRKISKLRISAGHAAALCYIMGSSGPKTDGDAYRWESPPSEKNLDWSLWDKACEFWVCLASSRDFIPVRTALVNLQRTLTDDDDAQGLGGNTAEKLAILAKAWEMFRDHPVQAGPPFADEDLAPGGALCLSYSDLDDKGNKLPDGEIKLLDVADFYGIDCPDKIVKTKSAMRGPPEPPPPPAEEIRRQTVEAVPDQVYPCQVCKGKGTGCKYCNGTGRKGG